MVPHHGTNWAALRLTAQIGRDAVLSESYGRGCRGCGPPAKCASPRGAEARYLEGNRVASVNCKLKVGGERVRSRLVSPQTSTGRKP